MHQGKLFKVVAAGLDEETGKTRYHLNLSDNEGISDDPSTHLEVVRQVRRPTFTVSGGIQKHGADNDRYNDSDKDNFISFSLLLALQGEFLAFRSAVAEDRFLQARRRGNLLSFFNTNLGELNGHACA